MLKLHSTDELTYTSLELFVNILLILTAVFESEGSVVVKGVNNVHEYLHAFCNDSCQVIKFGLKI